MSIPPDNPNRAVKGFSSPNAREPAANSSADRVSGVSSSTNLSPLNSNASLQGRVSPPMDKAVFEEGLSRWVAQAEPGENRAKAKRKILESIGSTDLDLEYLGLKSLPQEIGRLTSLVNLNLSENQLTEIPVEIGRLTSLVNLNLSENQLTEIPVEIGRLISLEILSLSENQLIRLPAEIGQLTSLESLKLTNNRLTEIPVEIGRLISLEILYLSKNQLSRLPTEIGQLTSLEWLKLENNRLTEIPVEIGRLISLKKLYLDNNRLSRLPTEIGQLTSLEWLKLTNNQLTEIPVEIGRLISLEILYLSNNPSLTGLPSEILNLSTRCRIDLTNCGLSPAIIDRFRGVAAAPGYRGPTISHSMREISRGNSNKPVGELLRDLYGIIDQKYEPLNNIPGDVVTEQTLQSWLARLTYMNDYNNLPERKQWVVTNILKYLKLADEDPQFRAQFAAIINDAGATCGDRAALSILHLGVAYKLATIDLRDMKALADFLGRGVWAIEMLEMCARQKIPTLRFFDEIEVYLGYPVMLKERLKLPIDVDEMIYFRCSALTPNDLAIAYEFVEGNLASKGVYYDFLVHHDKWKESLKLKNPSAYVSIERTREDQLERATEAEYEKIETQYREGLIDLTKKALEPQG